MKFAGYKRADTEEKAKAASANLRSALEDGDEMVFFAWDLTMGQRGFLRAVRAAQNGKVDGIIIEEIKDLGRDLVSLVKILKMLLDTNVVVRVQTSGLEILKPSTGRELNAESRIIQALFSAHSAYVNDNRKIGVAAARAAGAQVGRPAGITLDDAQEVIRRLMNTKDGRLPSVRDLAKEVECSVGKAQALLKQFKNQYGEPETAGR